MRRGTVYVYIVAAAVAGVSVAINWEIFLSGAKSLLETADELKADAMTAFQHVIRLQSGERAFFSMHLNVLICILSRPSVRGVISCLLSVRYS